MPIPLIHSSLGLAHALVLGALLFCLGLFGLLTGRNVLRLLMSLLLMLGAATLNLVAFEHFLHPEGHTGAVLALFGMLVGIAELSIGLGAAWTCYTQYRTLDLRAIEEAQA